MSNDSKKPAATAPEITLQTAPPEAYAAFVRIYMEWMEKEESEQLDLVEKSVYAAQKKHAAYTPNAELPIYGYLDKKKFILYQEEFDSYVNEIWYKFLERFEDVDKFAVYLQNNFNKNIKKYSDEYIKKCQKGFENQVDRFLNQEQKRWELETENMNDTQLDTYLKNEAAKMTTIIARMKKDFEAEAMIIYPSLRKLLRRPAQNMMEQLNKHKKNAAKGFVSIDETSEDGETPLLKFEDIKTDGRTVEAVLAINEILERTHITLDDPDDKILVLMMLGYNNKQISEQLDMKYYTVSKHIKKIRLMMSKALGIPMDNKQPKNSKAQKTIRAK